ITVTFECFKAGQLIYPGKEYAGEVKIIEIGYPWKKIEEEGLAPNRIYLDKKIAKTLYQPRKGFYHKGKTGHLLVLAGSRGKSGAGYLTALGALRAGVGLVTLASTKSLQLTYSSMLPEALTLGLPESDGEVSGEGIDLLLSALFRKKAIVVGPGFGLGSGAKKLLFALLEKANLPLLLDADALTLISEDLELLKRYSYPKVLTPHPGEAARLLSCEPNEVLKDPLLAINTLIERTLATIVLKGPHTIIASPSGKIYISSIDAPGLAQGGTGDVLSGVIGALMAQGYSAHHASALGVYLHGAAAKLLEETYGPFGFTAVDIAKTIPTVIKKLEEDKN
ncbi:MAG: NAD(P)H-hydrate dehydratase, partial [Caldimicrobium sp.]